MRIHLAFAVWIFLYCFGCGGQDEPHTVLPGAGAGGGEAGTGGSSDAGTGGGGTGGTGGGEAGSGGAEAPPCGNGRIDPDEECDDNNTANGDGCSSTCRKEGTCALPFEWDEVATQNTDGTSTLEGFFPLNNEGEPTRCSGRGRQLVIRYVPEHIGVLAVNLQQPTLTSLSIRAACELQVSEALCTSALVPSRLEIGRTAPLFIVVDPREEREHIDLSLTLQLHPYRELGETCSVQPDRTCAPGLTCDDVANKGRCVVNEAPHLDEVVAYRGGRSGDDLIVLLSGSDANGNSRSAHVGAYDEHGERVLIGDADRDGIPESPTMPLPVRNPPGQSTLIDTSASIEGFFRAFPQVHTIEAWLMDLEIEVSNALTAHVAPQPRRAEGEACDWYAHEDLCPDDNVCAPVGESDGTCRRLATMREERCATAIPVVVGEVLEARFPDASQRSSMSLWDAPLSCIDNPAFGSQVGQIEGLASLSLAEPLYDAVITTEVSVGGFDTVLFLHQGCGTEGEPLACNDDSMGRSGPSRLTFDVLPAGDYLIVVDKRRQGGGHWDLLVTGSTEP